MNEKEERAYEAGRKQAGVSLLAYAMQQAGLRADEFKNARAVIQLEEARIQLRHLCEEFGDNSFPDDLHLGDAIEKYLGKYLHDRFDTDTIQTDTDKPVCERCNDTHLIDTDEGGPFPGKSYCGQCPIPCQKCRVSAVGAYCAETPCDCDCHKDPNFQIGHEVLKR